MRIVFAGSIAYDYLMTFPGHFTDHLHADKLDSISVSFLVDNMTRHRGGTAPNIAYTHRLLGGQATLLGAAGKEDFGNYKTWLRKHGIDLSGVKEVPGMFSASFFANTDRNNLQIASFYAGAMIHAIDCRLADLPFKPDLVVISADYPQAMMEHVREAQALNVPYFFDPGQAIVSLEPSELREGIEKATIMVVNEYEWEMIQEKLGLTLKEVTGANRVFGVTLGEKGSRIYADGRCYEIPIVKAIDAKDPTGAGDAFRGALLRGYAAGLDWDLSGKMGAVAATYCLEQTGTQNHYYTQQEFVTRLRRHFDDRGLLTSITKDKS